MSSSESEGSSSSSSAGPWAVPQIPMKEKTWVVCATCGWAEWDRPPPYPYQRAEDTVILLCRWCFRVPAPPDSWGAVCNAEHFLRRMKLLPNCLQHVAVTDLIAVYLAAQDIGITYHRDEGIIDGRWAHTSVFEIGLLPNPRALKWPIVLDAIHAVWREFESGRPLGDYILSQESA